MNRKLGRKKSNREHLFRNQAASLVLYEYLDTTEAKAKEVKRFVERIIARSKKNTLAEKREVFSTFFDKNASMKLLNELLPRYEKRNSGFIRSFHLKNRLGDNAPMMRLELVDKKVFVEKPFDRAQGKKAVAPTSGESESRPGSVGKDKKNDKKKSEDIKDVKTTIKRKNKVIEEDKK